MSSEEMSRFVMHLMEQLDAIREELRVSNAEQQRLSTLVLSLTNQLHEAQQTITDLARKNEDLQSSLRVSNKHRFGSSSQKSRSKTEDTSGRDDNKGDFDGTADSLGGSSNVQAEEDASEVLPKESSSRPSRKGCSNKVMSADYQVYHRCDKSQIPAGAQILKSSIRKVFDSVSLIVEHDFEEITYKTADGLIHTSYFPVADDKDAHIYQERVQGTHATGNLLSSLVFDRYQMSTPAYREMSRMLEMRMSVSRQTLINWYSKVASSLMNLIPAMKK